MSGVMNLFRNFTGSAPAANQTPPGAAANPTIPNTNNANKSDGSFPAIPAATKNSAESPLAGFATLWQINNEGKGTEAPSLIPKFNMDPTKLSENVSKMDFLSAVPQDIMQKVMAGNDPTALLTVINTVGQQAFQRGMEINTRMMEKAFGAQADTLLSHTLPTSIKEHTTRTAVLDMTPVMQNPAVAPIADIIRQQFVQQNPTANATEIATAVNSYFQALGGEVLKSSGYQVQLMDKNAPAAPKTTDWDTWLPNQ